MASTSQLSQYTPVLTMSGCNGFRAFNQYDVSDWKKVSYCPRDTWDFRASEAEQAVWEGWG